MIFLIASFICCIVSTFRWYRVAQREHYQPGRTSLFARRWWWSTSLNRALLGLALIALVACVVGSYFGVVTLAICLGSPIGLGLRGRTSKLIWTRRMKTVALVSFIVVGGLESGIGLFSPHDSGRIVTILSCAVTLLMPVWIDISLALDQPIEEFIARKYVKSARGKLEAIRPRVIAITGSYGKTSTKNYLSHILSTKFAVFATPASFNNSLGLARAVNEGLGLGTEIFIAEMGTYGPGEIRKMCRWIVPDIAVITAIGPVHLERMGSEDVILKAKSEICELASSIVLNGDDSRLRALAQTLLENKRNVILASEQMLDGLELPKSVSKTNAACAFSVAKLLEVDEETISKMLETLPEVAHRRTIYTGETGITIIDDTYNSNPTGARQAVELLAKLGQVGCRRVVVTPGIVELGNRQFSENVEFARYCLARDTELMIVQRTNRKALSKGWRDSSKPAVIVDSRQQAVAWVRNNLAAGDVVLYENDLPDHFP